MMDRFIPKVASVLISLGVLFSLTGRQFATAESDTMPGVISSIDSYVMEQMNDLKIPGMAIGIVRGDQIEYVQGYGIADDFGRAMTPQTPFLIASFSKSITALSIMQLVDEGKIDLDAPVQTYIPWFQAVDAEASSKITVRHLLNQTSGFSELEGDKRNLNTEIADDALEKSIRGLKDQSLNFPPGTAFEYSNTNYDILGLMVQTVSGQSYESYIQESIFTPLEMSNSYTSLADARVGNMTSGYYPFFGFPVAWDRYMPYTRIVVPSTGLFSSAEDMTHYLIAHLNQGRYQGNSVVSPEGMAELHTPGIQYSENAGYAMGWTVFPFPQAAADLDKAVPTGIAHGGRWIGYRALMVLIPEEQVGVVVLMNKSDPGREAAMDNVGWSLALLALGLEPIDTPSEDFMTKNKRGAAAGIIVLLCIGLAWSVQKLRWLSSGAEISAQQKRKIVRHFILLAVLDLALAGSLLFIALPQDKDTIPLALNFRPDIGWMYVILLVMTLGWGVLRTGLFVGYLSKIRTSAKVS